MMIKYSKKMINLIFSFILAFGFVMGDFMPEKLRAAEVESVNEEFSISAFHNLDYMLSTIDGNTVSTKVLPEKDVTLLVFGRTTCATTWRTLKSIAESSWIYDSKVSVIYIDIDGADTEVIQGTIDQYAVMWGDEDAYRRGCGQIVFCHDADEKNEEVRYRYHSLSGKWGMISLPMIMLVDKNDVVREMLTGGQTADDIFSVMNQVIIAGDAVEEDKKDESGKDDTEKDDGEKDDIKEDNTGKEDVGNQPVTDNNTSTPPNNTHISNSQTCKIKSIKISAPKKSLRAGKSMKLKAVVKLTGNGRANQKLKWSSSKKKYATVNQNGKVKAKKAGKGKTVTITAAAVDGSGKRAKLKIRIK